MELEQVSLLVDDYDEAIRFYVDVLGFELVADEPASTNDGRPKRWVVVRPPGAVTALLLARADGPDQAAAVGQQFAGRVGLFLRVDDFAAQHEQMLALGVEFVTEPRVEPYGTVAVFRDICGNRWDLLGPRPEQIDDRIAIAGLVDAFFAAFRSGSDDPGRWARFGRLFLPGAVIVRTGGDEPVAYDVDGFVAPRRTLLSGGDLIGFREWPVAGRTDVFGDIAHWYGTYAKEGTQGGVAFTQRGTKTIQFVRTAAGWRISAAAWDDERPGVA